MLSQAYYVIIDGGFSAPLHIIEVICGLNATEKRFVFQFMKTVKLPGSKGYDTKVVIYFLTSTMDVSLSLEFQNTFIMWHVNME